MKKRAKDIKVSIWEMLYFVALKWRSIIIAMIIAGFLFGVLSYFQSIKIIETERETHQQEDAEVVEGYEEKLNAMGLSDDQKAEAERVAIGLYGFERAARAQEKYMAESVYINLDAENVSTNVLKYYVDNHLKVEYPAIYERDNTDAIIELLWGKVCCNDVYEKMAQQMNQIEKKKYMAELLSMTNINGVMEIDILAEDEEDASAFADIIDDRIQAVLPEVKSKVGDFDVVLVSNEYIKEMNGKLASDQKNASGNLYSISSNVRGYTEKLNSSVLAYAEVRCEQMMVETGVIDLQQEDVIGDKNESVEQQDVIRKPWVSKKKVLVGMILGLLLVAGWNILIYIFSGRIKSADDLENNFELPILGVLGEGEKERKRIFGFVDSLVYKIWNWNKRRFSAEESLKMIEAGIHVTSVSENAKSVYVTGCNIQNKEKEYIAQIAENLRKEDIVVHFGNNMVYNPESLIEMSQADIVILLETVRDSLYCEIGKEIELIRGQNKKVAGAIVVYR